TPASGTINGAGSLALATGTGSLLYCDGSNFEALIGGGGGSFTAGGDLSGTSSSQEVIGIQSKLIDGGPTDGDVLKYSSGSGKWEPTALPSQFAAGGDLSGSVSSQEVIGIQSHAIDGGPTDGDALIYSASSTKWEPT